MCIDHSDTYINNLFMRDDISRLDELIRERGWLWSDFARAYGTTNQRVYNWRKRGIPKGEAVDIAKIFGTTAEWLIEGKGARTTTLRERAAPYMTSNTEPGPAIQGFVPLISWVAAGAWTTVEDPYSIGDAEQWVPCPVSHGNHTLVLRVRGESMEPEYRDGDWIFVDPDRHPENGDHVVVRLDEEEEATFKKLVIEGGETYLVALNPAWPNRIIKIDGRPATIVGTVIFSGKPRI